MQLKTVTDVAATFLLLLHVGGCNYNAFSGELADVTAVVWPSAVVDSNSCAAQCRHFNIKPLPAPLPTPLPSFLNNSFSHLGKNTLTMLQHETKTAIVTSKTLKFMFKGQLLLA